MTPAISAVPLRTCIARTATPARRGYTRAFGRLMVGHTSWNFCALLTAPMAAKWRNGCATRPSDNGVSDETRSPR